jgi:uncharacterized protein with FMN-binding domain
MENEVKKTDAVKATIKKGSIVARIGWIGAGIILFFTAATFFFNRGMGKIHALEINSVNMAESVDGDYRGTYCEGRWCYDLTVIVKDQKVTDIRLNNNAMKMFDKLHAVLIKRIIDQQRVDVDCISGATITSKAFLKAVENAFERK